MAAKIHIDSVGGSNTSPYETWAKAAATLNLGLAVWAVGDEVFVHGGATNPHREAIASPDLLISATNDTALDIVPIFVVDNNSSSTYDAITDPKTSVVALIETTGNNTGMSLALNAHWHGFWFDSAESFQFNSAFVHKMTNCRIDFGTIDDANFSLQEGISCELINTDIGIGPTDGQEENVSFNLGDACNFNMYGGSISSNADNNYDTVFRSYSSGRPNAVQNLVGVDLTGLNANTAFTHLIEPPTARNLNFNFAQCRMPDFGLFKNVLQHGQTVKVFNSDEDSGDLHHLEHHQGAGDVITSTTLTRDWSDQTEPGISAIPLAYKFTPNSKCSIESPLEMPLPFKILTTTGSKVIDIELLENYTVALNDSEMWANIFYLGTLARTTWDVDQSSKVFVGTTPVTLDNGVGTGDWAGTTTGFVSKKLTATVTVNRTGYFMAMVFLGKFETAKVAYVCPLIDVT